MNFIQGNKFKSIATWHYAPARIYTGHEYRDAINNLPFNDYRFLNNTLDWAKLSDGDIIYTHTFYADQLIEKLEKCDKKVKVITHNADTNFELTPPDNVIRWYSQNVNIVHEKVFSVPIGIENDLWLKDKKKIMERKLHEKKNYKSMVYCNHNVKTNPKERTKPYELLKDKEWATVHVGSNGQGFDNYIHNVYNHPFCIAPAGNGMDTHRIWECLYMNTIPIVIKNINNSFYADLPILFLEDWDELSEKFLFNSFMEMSRAKWNINKLDFEYWRNEILS